MGPGHYGVPGTWPSAATQKVLHKWLWNKETKKHSPGSGAGILWCDTGKRWCSDSAQERSWNLPIVIAREIEAEGQEKGDAKRANAGLLIVVTYCMNHP